MLIKIEKTGRVVIDMRRGKGGVFFCWVYYLFVYIRGYVDQLYVYILYFVIQDFHKTAQSDVRISM